MSEQPKSWIEIVEDGLVPLSLTMDPNAFIHARPAGSKVAGDGEDDWRGPWSEFYSYGIDGSFSVVSTAPDSSYLWWYGDYSYDSLADDVYANALFTIKLEVI